ncbi:peptidase M23 [Pluralibacter gergoviae]|nr:peptidase M23 [Pluralibacter gergoviae]EKV6250080.1 peptidase M23 [Pluralibacter gergoviae]EKW9969608.1 peptidase M23 [Pluralibacter gergoviae]ELD4274445.1 peptidase M23 [Pluralibacter gergoviae]ELD4280055.1 peptidase M23 [Pluralibacter gergoviae]
MMPVNPNRGYPLNEPYSWHGGIHITHTDSTASPEKVRAIADGTVISFRKPSPPWKRDQVPLQYAALRGTDNGYVLLKHETEIGTGERAKVIFYSLYMHLSHLEEEIKTDANICRKSSLGTSGMVDGRNEFHFQIFCDDDNVRKITGRATPELDISRHGRTDAVYGDIHFYLPVGTIFYEARPANSSADISNLHEVYTSTAPLYVSMTLSKGNCTLVTRQASAGNTGGFEFVGDPLINADGDDYEYNLYRTAMSLYSQSPSAGYELLRFGRVINTDHETLIPADAPLWMTISYPGGRGVVNLAVDNIKKFSDADFPHWAGWNLVNDDGDTHSQCNSAAIRTLKEQNRYTEASRRLICFFPFEWEQSTIDARYRWLVTGLPWEQCTQGNTVRWQPSEAQEWEYRDLMSEESYNRFREHVEALCFDSEGLGAGKVWHFDPQGFIEHFRKCGWIGLDDIIRLVRANESVASRPKLSREQITQWITEAGTNRAGDEIIRPDNIKVALPKMMRKYLIVTPLRISHFFGQLARETGRFKSFVEAGDVHYFDMYEPGQTQGDRLGNTVVGDGVRFKGRGIIHLTGRENYRSYSVYRYGHGSDFFITEPNNILPLADPYVGCDTGGCYWASKQRIALRNNRRIFLGGMGLNYWADQGYTDGNTEQVTRGINPGLEGFQMVRLPAFRHAWFVINDEAISPDDYRPIDS